MIVFSRQTSLIPALVFLFLLGIPLAALNTALSPLFMHIIPHDIMGRVMSVLGTSQTVCNLLSIAVAGLLGTLFASLQFTVLSISFGTYDAIYTVTGLLFILGGVYAMVNLHHMHIEE